MQKWYRKNNKNKEKGPTNANSQVQQRNFAAIDLGTNSCRLVIATPTPAAFRIVETFSKITRLGEGIIKDNELSRPAIKRTVAALKVCAGVINEYAPIYRSRFVATAACRRAKNCSEFVELVKRETGLNLEIISSKEESRQISDYRGYPQSGNSGYRNFGNGNGFGGGAFESDPL
jgi:cell division ATPase FtsA